MSRLPALALVLLCACGDDATPAARAVPVTDAAQLEQPADASAPQERPAPDASAVEQDSAVDEPADASAPDAEALVAPPVDAGRVVPMVTADQLDSKQLIRCTECHHVVAKAVLPYLDFTGLLRLAFVEGDATISTCDDRRYVVPGHPEQSYLLRVFDADAPCGKHVAVPGMTAVELQLLSDWIAGGAR